mgnify:CR=1 FL=1
MSMGTLFAALVLAALAGLLEDAADIYSLTAEGIA